MGDGIQHRGRQCHGSDAGEAGVGDDADPGAERDAEAAAEPTHDVHRLPQRVPPQQRHLDAHAAPYPVRSSERGRPLNTACEHVAWVARLGWDIRPGDEMPESLQIHRMAGSATVALRLPVQRSTRSLNRCPSIAGSEIPGLNIDTQKDKGSAPCSTEPLIVAEWTGLEPATPGVTGRYSNQLNYHSMWRQVPRRVSRDAQVLL